MDREWPTTAVELMCSRFDAFRNGDIAWLENTWHETTRPNDLNLADNPRWRGLQIIDTVDGGENDATGIVEFRATYIDNDGNLGILHERSNFVKVDGRWYYVDGDVQ